MNLPVGCSLQQHPQFSVSFHPSDLRSCHQRHQSCLAEVDMGPAPPAVHRHSELFLLLCKGGLVSGRLLQACLWDQDGETWRDSCLCALLSVCVCVCVIACLQSKTDLLKKKEKKKGQVAACWDLCFYCPLVFEEVKKFIKCVFFDCLTCDM